MKIDRLLARVVQQEILRLNGRSSANFYSYFLTAKALYSPKIIQTFSTHLTERSSSQNFLGIRSPALTTHPSHFQPSTHVTSARRYFSEGPHSSEQVSAEVIQRFNSQLVELSNHIEKAEFFIHHAWESKQEKETPHNNWVKNLARCLRNAGNSVDTDQEKYPGFNVSEWMASAISDVKKNKFILVICTPTYLEKVLRDTQDGKLSPTGTQTELRFIISGWLTKAPQIAERVIPILLEGSSSTSIAPQLAGKLYLDGVHCNDFEMVFKLLHGIEAYRLHRSSTSSIDQKKHEHHLRLLEKAQKQFSIYSPQRIFNQEAFLDIQEEVFLSDTPQKPEGKKEEKAEKSATPIAPTNPHHSDHDNSSEDYWRKLFEKWWKKLLGGVSGGAASLWAFWEWYLKEKYKEWTKKIEQRQDELDQKWSTFEKEMGKWPLEISPLGYKKKLHFFHAPLLNGQRILPQLIQFRQQINTVKGSLGHLEEEVKQLFSSLEMLAIVKMLVNKEKYTLDRHLNERIAVLNYLGETNEIYITLAQDPSPDLKKVEDRVNTAIQTLMNKQSYFTHSINGVGFEDLIANAYSIQAKIRRSSNPPDWAGSERAYQAALERQSSHVPLIKSNYGALLVDRAYQHIPRDDMIKEGVNSLGYQKEIADIKGYMEKAIKLHEEAISGGGSCQHFTSRQWEKVYESTDLQILTDYAWSLRVLACAKRLEAAHPISSKPDLTIGHHERTQSHHLLDKVLKVLDDQTRSDRHTEVNRAQPLLFKGILHMDEGEVSKAKEYFKQVLEITPTHPQALKRMQLIKETEQTQTLSELPTKSCCVRLAS